MTKQIKVNVPQWQPTKKEEFERGGSRGIDAQPTQWQQLPGILPPVVQREFRGINKLERFSIEPAYATETKNATSRDYPALTGRPDFTQLGSTFAARILGLATWKHSELQAIVAGEWRKWSSGSWSSALESGIDSSAAWSFCNFKGNFSDFNLLASNGVDAVMKYDGNTVSNLDNAPSNANYIDTHDNRVYVAVGNQIHASALADAEDWSDTDPFVGTAIIEIIEETGKDINGLKAGTGHLLAFFPSATYELYGTGPDDFKMTRIANDIGLITNRCLVNVSGILYWMDRNAIYRYTGGTRPKSEFSQVVQYYVDGINHDHADKCCAGTDGKRFYISLPYGDATEPNITLEYDPDFSGAWYVWEDITPLVWANGGDALYMGDADGKVFEMDDETSSSIEWDWVSIPFGAKVAGQDIRWYRTWIIADVPVGASCEVFLSPSSEGNDWTSVKVMTTDSDIQKQRVILPIADLANAGWLRVKFECTGAVKIHEFDYQQRELPLV